MVYIKLDNKFDFGIWFCTLNSYCVWLNGVGKNRESNEAYDKDCIEEGLS